MSGLAGIIYPDRFQVTHLVDEMLMSLRHRGKGDFASYAYLNIELGTQNQSRLFSNKKRTVFVGLDGDLHNKEQLVSGLKQLGRSPDPTNSLDLLVQAYEAFPEHELLEKLEGEYAFFIFDKEREQLLLARDRLGKKPLYWLHIGEHFYFGSELKSILATGAVPQTVAEDALATYLFFGYLPQDMTPIQGINKLLPGFSLRIQLDHTKSIAPYWSYSSLFEDSEPKSSSEVAHHLEKLLEKAILQRRCLEEARPLSCFISGGLGSTTIAHTLRSIVSDAPVSGYSCNFKGQNDADLEAAGLAAKALEMEHRTFSLTPDNLFDHFVKIAWHLDEPLADPNVLATYHLGRLAAEKTDCVFSGMGSDELLAAHARYYLQQSAAPRASHFLSNLFKPIQKHLLFPLIRTISPKRAFHILQTYPSNPSQVSYLYQNALFPEEQHTEISPLLKGLFDTDVFLHKFHHSHRIKNDISSFLYFDVKTRLADLFMHQFDRLTAAHSLRWEAPFLDNEIVSYLAAISGNRKLSFKKTPLNLILEGKLPESVVKRPKEVRTAFLTPWIDHPSIFKIFQLLSQGTLVEAGYISRRWLQKLLAPKKRRYHFQHLFALLSLEVWMRLYTLRPVTTEPPECTLEELLREV